jgi:hypothetical protein
MILGQKTAIEIILRPGGSRRFDTLGISELRISGGLFQIYTDTQGVFNFRAKSIDCRGIELIDFTITNISNTTNTYSIDYIPL